jgi:hypothetical protein
MAWLLKNRLQREQAILGSIGEVTKWLQALFRTNRAQFDARTTPPEPTVPALNANKTRQQHKAGAGSKQSGKASGF